MIKVPFFLQQLMQRGAKLWVEGEDIRCQGSPEVLTQEALTTIKQHKTDCLNYLSQYLRRDQLSDGQQALWFLHQNSPQSAAYHIAAALNICSAVDVQRLQRTWDTLIKRHDVLRTVFVHQDQQLTQQILTEITDWFEHIDSSHWSQQQLNTAIHQAYQQPFDLRHGPLIRVKLYQQNTQSFVLLITLHHIIFDAWSLRLLLQEFSVGYQDQDLPPLQYDYQDFIHWQQAQQILNHTTLSDYWQQRLAPHTDVLTLPIDFPRPTTPNFQGAAIDFQLPPALSQQLHDLAQAHDATLFHLLLAVFQILLHRYSGQTNINVGCHSAGRDQAQFMNVMGYFVNPLVMQADFSNHPCVVDLLTQVRNTVLAALAHQHYPFNQLVEQLQPKRIPGYSPLFQVNFGFHQPPVGDITELLLDTDHTHEMRWAGLNVKPYPLAQQLGQFDLTLEMSTIKDNLLGVFKYNTDLFASTTIQTMIGHFSTLLQACVDQPQQTIAELGYQLKPIQFVNSTG